MLIFTCLAPRFALRTAHHKRSGRTIPKQVTVSLNQNLKSVIQTLQNSVCLLLIPRVEIVEKGAPFLGIESRLSFGRDAFNVNRVGREFFERFAHCFTEFVDSRIEHFVKGTPRVLVLVKLSFSRFKNITKISAAIIERIL